MQLNHTIIPCINMYAQHFPEYGSIADLSTCHLHKRCVAVEYTFLNATGSAKSMIYLIIIAIINPRRACAQRGLL